MHHRNSHGATSNLDTRTATGTEVHKDALSRPQHNNRNKTDIVADTNTRTNVACWFHRQQHNGRSAAAAAATPSGQILSSRKIVWHALEAQEQRNTMTTQLHAVASLGLVSPGEATEGVTPIFPEKNDDLF